MLKNKTKQNSKNFSQKKNAHVKSVYTIQTNTCTIHLSGKKISNMQNRNVNAGNGPKKQKTTSPNEHRNEKKEPNENLLVKGKKQVI